MTPAERGPVRALHLFALSGFAVAQPLLDLLARYAELFVARDSEPGDVVALVAGLLLLPPAALAAAGALATRLSRHAGRTFHLAAVGVLVALVAAPLWNRIDVLPPALAVLRSALTGAAGAFAYARLRGVRRVVTVLALAPPIFAGVFFAREPVRAVLAGDVATEVPRVALSRPAPVVLVVFDELSRDALLGGDGRIDAHRYPGFARLAASSTWLRGATTVESRTLQAIPALLSGRYPTRQRRLPLASQHPANLFSLLAPRYHITALESLTRLHRTERQPEPTPERLGGLARDVALIYAHVVLPDRLADRLPSVRRTWRDFAAGRTAPRRSKRSMRGRPSLFRSFVRQIRPGGRSLSFVHALLPHGPWQYLPSGASFHPYRNYGRFLGVWSEEPYFTVEAWQRHLLQLELVDRLLGELLDHLEATGLFDRTLLVVTADHGVSFWPGDHFRNFEAADHPADILRVPLFVKRPGQRTAEVSDRNVELVDVLPTVLDVLGADAATVADSLDLDGCSVFGPDCRRGEKTAFSPAAPGSQENRRHRFPADVGSDATLRRKLDLFGDGRRKLGLYRFGAYGRWVGRPLRALPVAAEPAGVVRLDPARRTWQLGADEALVPARVVGTLAPAVPAPERVHVAVAVGETLAAAVPVPDDGRGLRLAAMLPEALLAPDAPIRLFRISGPPAAPRLRPLQVR